MLGSEKSYFKSFLIFYKSALWGFLFLLLLVFCFFWFFVPPKSNANLLVLSPARAPALAFLFESCVTFRCEKKQLRNHWVVVWLCRCRRFLKLPSSSQRFFNAVSQRPQQENKRAGGSGSISLPLPLPQPLRNCWNFNYAGTLFSCDAGRFYSQNDSVNTDVRNWSSGFAFHLPGIPCGLSEVVVFIGRPEETVDLGESRTGALILITGSSSLRRYSEV